MTIPELLEACQDPAIIQDGIRAYAAFVMATVADTKEREEILDELFIQMLYS